MPIALPAPTTPELGSADVLRSQGGDYVTASLKQNQVHVHGPEVVPKETVEMAITGAENLSDAVRRIQGVYYLAGYPAVRVVYALAEPDLYVSVSLGKVTKVEAPERYAVYFRGITSADPLTDDALEPARTLASLHADRAGQSAIPTFVPDGDGSVLRIEPDDNGPGRSGMGLGFGNPGNRFVGRHFTDWFARHSFTTGDELLATGRYGMEGLDNNEGSDGYNEFTLGWGKVTPWGLLGLQGRNVDYQQNLAAVPPTTTSDKYTGNIRQAELGWTGLLSSNFYSRWGVGAKVDYTRKSFDGIRIDAPVVDGPPALRHEVLVQRQEYGSVELSTLYSLIVNPLDFQTELSAGVAVRSGLGSNKRDKATTLADLGYLLFRPTLGAKTKLSDLLTLRLSAIAQITSDTLPEQQQWVVGGIGNLESYLPGVASGDSGALGRVQLETSSYEFATVKFVPAVFAEYGYAKNEKPFDGQSGATQSLADGGVSLAMVRGPFEAAVSYAESFHEKNVTKEALHDSDANLFFRVAMKF